MKNKSKNKEGDKKIHPLQDKLLKNCLNDPKNAAQLFMDFLPKEISGHIQWQYLKHADGSAVSKVLEFMENDILYESKLNDGEQCFVYVVLENQATRNKWVPLRLLRYMAEVWHRYHMENPEHQKLPPIMPL